LWAVAPKIKKTKNSQYLNEHTALYHLHSLNLARSSKHLISSLNLLILCASFLRSKNILNLNKQQSGWLVLYFAPSFTFACIYVHKALISRLTLVADFATVMTDYCGQ
jgi:hypothetical protein